MPDALLFKPGEGDAPPAWKVCADDWIDFYVGRGWMLLGREKDIRTADVEQVREEEERRWNPPKLWRKRPRHGTTGE